MRPSLLATALAALVMACTAGRAQAAVLGGEGGARGAMVFEGAGGVIILAAAGLAAADLGFTVYDGVMAAQGQRISNGAAIAEIAIAAPQVLLYGAAVGYLFAHDVNWGARGFALGMTAYTGLLLAHGIASLHADGSSRRTGRPRIAFALGGRF